MEEREHTAEEQELDLRYYAKVLRRRWMFMVAAVVITVAASIPLRFMDTPIYRAETTLQVNAAVIRPQDMDPFSGLFLSREAVPTLIELAKTPLVLDQVRANLDLAATDQTLGKVTASQIGSTGFFKVIVKNRDPAVARDVANEVAEVLKVVSISEWQGRVATTQLLLQLRLDELEGQISDTRAELASAAGDPQILALQLRQYETQYGSTLSSLQESRLVLGRVTDVLNVRSSASAPSSPVGSNDRRNLVFALLLGGVLGFAVVLLVEYLDTRVKSPEQIRRLLGQAVIAALPALPDVKKLEDGLVLPGEDTGPILEPYHLLRTNLRFTWRESEPRTVLITSAEIGEGKTTMAANLGVALAESGQQTVLIDCDLRHPRIHSVFGLPVADGLTQLLMDRDATIADCTKQTSVENLQVITAGSRVSNPSVLLGSQRMDRLLTDLRQTATVLLLDCSPVLYGSDTLTLTPMADQVLLVIGAGMLHGDTVARAREALKMVEPGRVEVVLNKVSRDTDPYSYYSYYYSHRSEKRPS